MLLGGIMAVSCNCFSFSTSFGSKVDSTWPIMLFTASFFRIFFFPFLCRINSCLRALSAWNLSLIDAVCKQTTMLETQIVLIAKSIMETFVSGAIIGAWTFLARATKPVFCFFQKYGAVSQYDFKALFRPYSVGAMFSRKSHSCEKRSCPLIF